MLTWCRFITSADTYGNFVRQVKSKQYMIDKMEAAGLSTLRISGNFCRRLSLLITLRFRIREVRRVTCMKICLLVSSTFFYFPLPPFRPLFPLLSTTFFLTFATYPTLPFPIHFSSVYSPSSFGIPTSSPCQIVLHIITTSSLHPSLPNRSPVTPPLHRRVAFPSSPTFIHYL